MPAPGAGEILVKVAAAGVNRPDVMQRQGLYPPPKGATDIPGLEIAGEVVALGAGVHALEGRRQGLRARGRRRLCRILPRAREPRAAGAAGACRWSRPRRSRRPSSPSGTTCSSAAALKSGRDAAGAWRLVRHRHDRDQLAKAFGARVITTAGSAEKCEACRKLGADVAINYKTEDFVAATKAATGGKGANVILDMVGGDYIERNYEAAAVEGRIVQIAFQGSPKADGRFPPHHAQAPDAYRLDAARRARSPTRPRSRAPSRSKVWPLIAAGKVRPVIDTHLPARARPPPPMPAWRSSAHIGKIVLTV